MKFEDLFCDSFEKILSDFKTNEDRLQEMVGLMRSDRSVFCQEMRAEPYRFSEEQVLRAAERYRLGGSRNGETVFWLIDEAGRVRDGMVGDTFASVLLKQRGILDKAWCAQHCLFGMHLLAEAQPRVPVAVVEDVQCAVILSEVYPTFVWLATGYPANLQLLAFLPLRGRKVVCFPRTDSTGSNHLVWLELVKDIRSFGINIMVSDFLEEKSSKRQKDQEIDLLEFIFDSEGKPSVPPSTPTPSS